MALWADQAVTATGLNGLTQGRFVGVTVSGAPASGAFSVGDYVITQNGQMFVCTVTGSPGTWVSPSPLSDVVSTGEEILHRRYVGPSSTTALTTSTLFLTYFTARKTETTTQVRISSGTTAAATVTTARIGLYSIDPTTLAGTLVASTANDTALFTAASTAYTKSWTSSYAKTAGGRYAVGVVVVATTTPSLFGMAALSTSGFTEYGNVAPRLCARLTSQSDLPSTFTDASLTTTGTVFYGVILP